MAMCHYMSFPVRQFQGDIRVSGDKTISHLVITLSAIASGTSVIRDALVSEDCALTLRAFQAMGVVIQQPEANCLLIHGVGKYGLVSPSQTIHCGHSGTSMRLLAGLLSAQSFDSQLTGYPDLLRRPMTQVSRPLQQMGADMTTHDGCAPIVIRGGFPLQGIQYEMPEANDQVKASLLLAGMYAQGETQVMESNLTRDHTERLFTTFGYPIQKTEDSVSVNGGSECCAVELRVPGDLSSAAFFIVAATLIPGAKLILRDVGVNPTRKGILILLKEMGAHIEIRNKRLCGEEPIADLYVCHASLEGIDIPASFVSITIDEFPILLIAAACAKGQTLLHGARELRAKEHDRIQIMANGLKRLGIDVQLLDDGIFVKGGRLLGGTVDAGHDHRVALSFAIAGALASAPVTILNGDRISSTFPAFMVLAEQLGLHIKQTSEVRVLDYAD